MRYDSNRPKQKNQTIKVFVLILIIIILLAFYFLSKLYPSKIKISSSIIHYNELTNDGQAIDVKQNISTNFQENELRCLPNGWPRDGSKLWWKFYYYPEYPSLQDIFEDNGELVVILSTFLIKTHRNYKQRMIKYHSSKWALYLHKDNQENNTNAVINPKDPIIAQPDVDKKIYIIKLRFTLPKKYQNKYNYATIQILLDDEQKQYRPLKGDEPLHSPEFYKAQQEIQYKEEYTKIFMKRYNLSNSDDLSYRNVPFCAIKDKFSIYVNPPPKSQTELSPEEKIYTSPNGQKKDFLRLCTQNLIFDEKEKNEDIFRWLLYHIEQGFSKPIIYVNKILSSEKLSFSHYQKVIDLGMTEMIYYVFPYAFFFHEQPSQEISCNERNRGRTVWLAHNDVDEMFYYLANGDQNIESNITIAEILKNKYTNVNNIEISSGLKCPNLWMKRLSNDDIISDSIKKQNQRTKGITIPENVNFYYVHFVTTGKRMIIPTEIINAHFKNLSLIHQEFKKEVFCPRASAINKRLTEEIKKYLI